MLEELWMNGNNLHGSLPDKLFNLVNIKKIMVYKNKLTGNLSTNIGYKSELEVLKLGDNILSGTLLSQLGNLHNVQNLILTKDSFRGTVPSILGIIFI